jgi:hypothetical protein
MQIQTLIPVFERLELNSGSPRSVALLDMPADGTLREVFTRAVQKALRDAGFRNRVLVTKPADRDLAVASVELPGRGWFRVPMPDESPP